MLHELVDIAFHEDFVHGLSRASGLRVCTYDAQGRLISARGPDTDLARRTGWVLERVPAGLELTPVPAHDPPGGVAFVCDRGVWYVLAPVYVEDQHAGWVGVGEFREPTRAHLDWPDIPALSEITAAWGRLPLLDRSGNAHAVITARWGARLLAGWCRRELRLVAATEEAALVGDIAELIAGREYLQEILDHIVADTARVMKCRFCSLRLYDPQTDELRIQAVHNLSERYLQKGSVRRSENPIDDEVLTGKVVYVEDVSADPRILYPAQMRAEGIVSQLSAGMVYRGQPVGVIRVYTDRRRRFRVTERNLLRVVANQAATAIVHAQLVEERLRSAETERQLKLAADLQARMMRIPPPRHPRLATASVYQPSSRLGGDFCDIFNLRDGRLAAVVADVVGKGIPAALLSASIRGALAATAECCGDLGELLTRLNQQVYAETLPSEFVTLVMVAVDAEGDRLGYCLAGHEPLLLWREGRVQVFNEGGLVLGLRPDETYRETTMAVRPDDLFLLYTDGFVDAGSFAGELFGRQRLLAAVRQYGDLPVDQVLRNILWDVRRFVGLAEQVDDLTMVGVKVLPTERA